MELEKEPSIGISYTCELPGKKALVMQSFVPRDCEQSDLDKVLDKVRVASERQFAFGAIEQLKLQLEQEQKLASDHAARMAQADENLKNEWNRGGRRGDLKLSQKQEQEQRQAYAHAEESKKRIAKVKADIADYQAKIGPQAQPGA
jgi:hypothetical protein